VILEHPALEAREAAEAKAAAETRDHFPAVARAGG
jgi:hypothetical protein